MGRRVADGGQFGTTGYDGVFAMDADVKGTYLAGVRGWVGGTGNGFVRMLKPGGATKWTHSLATAGDEEYLAIVVTDGAIYAGGRTTGNINDPTAPPGTNSDGFVERLRRSDGSRVWIKRIRGSDRVWVNDFAVLGQALFASGSTEGALKNCSPSPCDHLGQQDAFVRRFDTAGNASWTRQLGTAGWDNATAADAADGANFVGGLTDGEVYVRRFTKSGAVTWKRRFGVEPGGFISARDLSANEHGVYAVGAMGTGIEGTGHEVDGGEDAYVRMYSHNGALRQTRQFGSPGTDDADGVHAFGGSVIVGGNDQRGPLRAERG